MKEKSKQATEFKTFQVPFGLEAINKNICIYTNTNIQISKEQIINKAFKFHSQGNISEAARYYKDFINKGFDDYRVYFKYGVILEDQNKIKEAEISYRKAIKLNPAFVGAHYNLGNILASINNIKEAEISYRKAIKLKPNFDSAYYNLGNILKDLGNLKEAVNSYRKAINLNPSFANAHYNLGHILKDTGSLNDAFNCYIKVLEIDPNYPNIYSFITKFISESNPSHFNKSKLKNVLDLLLENSNLPHKELFTAFHFLYKDEIRKNQKIFTMDYFKDDSYKLLINDKLIIKALKKITFRDVSLEKILTNTRKNICYKISEYKEEISQSELKFVIALGEQCFINEYIYSCTKEEKISINKILNRCINGGIDEPSIAILSCYFPLYKLLAQIPSLKTFISSDQNFVELIELQILEPLKEIELSRTIQSLGSINDIISNKVKAQYEKNPYPRWRYGNHSKDQKFSFTQAINIDIHPNSINHNEDKKETKVLIAGCGTGNQILQAQKYKNSQITGIDLSLSSLSYAKRKINELKIDNVKLIQMDILEVGLLKEKFDIIECSGVLHHMNDPLQGLKPLLAVLKNCGFLNIGLYSELARKDIVKARKYISSKNLEPTTTDIRRFRNDVISGTYPEIDSLQMRSSFYSMSECRDLCFHAMEHRFTIDQIQDILKTKKLKFLGFLLRHPVKSLYKKYFPEDITQTNLHNWRKFEEKHPNTFRGMYQFWVCKTNK